MKKAVLLFGLIMAACPAFAGQDRLGSMRPAVWRSSTTSTGELDAVVATGTIIVHGVEVNFTGLNSSIQLFNGVLTTATASAGPLVDTSSGTYGTHRFDVVFSSGLAYQKKGSANVTILWDWVVDQPGRSSVGK